MVELLICNQEVVGPSPTAGSIPFFMQTTRPVESFNERNASFDNRLRPTRFDDFVGQKKVRDRLMLAVEAARQRKEPLDHVLLSGPPGLGKTTLAFILGEAMGV